MRANQTRADGTSRGAGGPLVRAAVASVLIFCGAVALPARAAGAAGAGPDVDEEWPRFRGPRGAATSDATTVPVSFTEADYNWSAKLPGTGHSSPVVWGERVFVTSAETGPGEDRGKRHLLCFDTRGGRELWRRSFDFSAYQMHSLNSFAVSTPALDAERVYVVWTSPGSVTAVAFGHDGREAWRRDLGPFGAQHGPGTSPVVIGGTLLLGNDQEENESFIAGLDCATGRTLWKHARRKSKASYATPAELVREGRREAVFTSTSHGVTGLDPATGRVLWEAGGVFRQRCVSSPVVAGGVVFATAGLGTTGKEAVAVRPGAAGAGAKADVAYRLKRDIPYVPTPVAVGDLLFVLSERGSLTCVRASTGEVLGRTRIEGRFYSSPVCVGGRLYLVSMEGDVVVLDASETLRPLGRSSLGEKASATPAVSRGVMYLRTEGRLVSVGGR